MSFVIYCEENVMLWWDNVKLKKLNKQYIYLYSWVFCAYRSRIRSPSGLRGCAAPVYSFMSCTVQLFSIY